MEGGQPQNEKGEQRQTILGTMQTEGIVHFRMETYDYLHKLNLLLKGHEPVLKYDKEGQPFETFEQIKDTDGKPVNKPLINDIGLRKLMIAAQMIIDKTVAQGNITEERHILLCKGLRLMFLRYLAFYWREWGIDRADRHLILEILDNTFNVYLSRALFGGERRSIGSPETKIVESSVVTESKKGWLFGK